MAELINLKIVGQNFIRNLLRMKKKIHFILKSKVKFKLGFSNKFCNLFIHMLLNLRFFCTFKQIAILLTLRYTYWFNELCACILFLITEMLRCIADHMLWHQMSVPEDNLDMWNFYKCRYSVIDPPSMQVAISAYLNNGLT